MCLYAHTEESQCGSDAAEELWKHLFMFCRAKQVESFSVDLRLLACCQGLSYYCVRPNYITKQKWKQPSTRPRHRKKTLVRVTRPDWVEMLFGMWGKEKHSNVVKVLLGASRFIPGGSSQFSSNQRHHRWALCAATTTKVSNSRSEFCEAWSWMRIFWNSAQRGSRLLWSQTQTY